MIRCVLSLLLLGYLVFGLLKASEMEASARCAGFDVRVEPTAAARNFVTASQVRSLMADWKLDNDKMAASRVPLQRIEDRLNAVDNIEEATVWRLPDNRVRVSVKPMVPVARVFDGSHSYYINRAGKRLTANSRYRLDVPVVCGHFDAAHPATSVIPVVDWLQADSGRVALVQQILVDPRNRDIILVPTIRGHVINMGDADHLDSKMERVLAMYQKVLPLKGWNYYDTISVKWGGQVVATRRVKAAPEPLIAFDQEGDADTDINSMLTDTVTAREERIEKRKKKNNDTDNGQIYSSI